MKKIILTILILVLAGNFIAYGQMYKYWYTDNKLNGYFIVEANDANLINYYIQGALDTMQIYDRGTYDKYYAQYNLGVIYDKIVYYYTKRQDRLKLPVIEVLRLGIQ